LYYLKNKFWIFGPAAFLANKPALNREPVNIYRKIPKASFLIFKA